MKKLECVLLIDDDEIANQYVQILFEDLGIAEKVQVTNNGKEGLDYLMNKGKYVENGKKYPQPQLIFLDINMPVMNGFDFLDAYHQLPNKQKGDIVIVMLTTSLLESDRKKAMAYTELSGFTNKPISEEFIIEIIKNNFPED